MWWIPKRKIRKLLQKYLTDSLNEKERKKLATLAYRYPEVIEIKENMVAEGLASPEFLQREEEALQKGLAKARAILCSPDQGR